MPNDKHDVESLVYTVVEVTRGVAAGAYCFRRLKEARLYMMRLCKDRNLDEDDVQLFETIIDRPKDSKWSV